MDIVERLPVPFGLVRFGVAPDHPEVKVSLSKISWHSTVWSRISLTVCVYFLFILFY